MEGKTKVNAKPQFRLCKEDGKTGARTGCITTSRGVTAETPFGLVKGLPGYLTMDNLKQINGVKGLHVCASHFFDRSGLGLRDGRPLSEVMGQEEDSPVLVFCGLRDPVRFNLNLYPAVGSGNISVETEAGVTTACQDSYMRFVKEAQPDFCLSLSDDIMNCNGKKRRAKAVKRTSEWLGESLNEFGGSGEELKSVGLIASILATERAEDNLRQAQAAAAASSDPSVVGYAIMGLGLGESEESRRGALLSICGQLSKDKVRYTSGPSTPIDLLRTIECGIDVVDTGFVNELTACGMAMVFPTDREGVPDPEVEDGFNLNLWSDEFIHDQRPLKENCECYTCRNGFSRGYIHHLLECRELLAEVLLEFHNTHHMCSFMKTIRTTIEEGVFSEYTEEFQKSYTINTTS
ncbi:queuine tRNA-ribosyltransferase [Chloropicon primus]|nr:queuine tRNA-ribosyltransferase [Chloropicon primus]